MDAKLFKADQELEELLEAVSSGRKDSELLKRARERADEIRKEMGAKYGHRNIAVRLIREARDDE
jgi:hypothetical protein